MRIQALGHVVLKVRNREKAEAFYGGLLGLPIVARFDRMGMTFFSLGNHHDFAVAAVGDDAPGPVREGVGLAHVAFKIGDDVATLKSAKAELEAAGVSTVAADHGVSKSLYFSDPDGNRVELYVDQSDSWRRDPQTVAAYQPLEL
ncbi:VOC family protein [Stella sp.]|uniref:VOC family protein n=1 Tax=Stella sp. TaxID=2912054 RepID=UPI0035ADBA1E